MKYFKLLCCGLGILLINSCSDTTEPPQKTPESNPIPIRAADISFLPQIRVSDVTFKNSKGEIKDVLELLKDEGCNTIRLRLWHTPSPMHSDLQEVAAFTQEIRGKGLKVWLSIHFSDTWADPGAQTKPLAWSTLAFDDLADSVYNYTKKVVSYLGPDFVQIGNEINAGFLWPDGNINNMTNFTTLLKQGVKGARDASPDAKIMIHFSGIEGSSWFYEQLNTRSIDYDIIALSYYPRWHTKSLSTVRSVLQQLVTNNNKDVVLAETAYPFTLQWNDWTNNIVGLEEHLIPGYPATPKGQYDFLMELRKIMSENNRGLGLCYWAPEWVAYKGNQAEDGSAWENMTLFDFSFKALEGTKIFQE